MKKQKLVFSENYEIAGNPLSRQFWHWFRMKTRIMGNFDTGPGLINLARLWLIHKIGKPIYWLRIRLKNQHSLKQIIKKGFNFFRVNK